MDNDSLNATTATPADAPPTPLSEDEAYAALHNIPPECIPNADELIFEDGKPMENIFAEKQARLLTEPLYGGWSGPGEGVPFFALANVALYHRWREAALVPDVMLSLDVEPARDLSVRENRSYLVWVIGKPPTVVIEFVSDRRGGEFSHKFRAYARIGVPYYVIFDPDEHLGGEVLQAFGLREGHYEPVDPSWLPTVGLGLKLWEGSYEGQPGRWLRWCDRQGEVIPTGDERATRQRQRAELAEQLVEQERQRADNAEQRVEQERQQAEQERKRAEQERQRAKRLAERLRELGMDPDA